MFAKRIALGKFNKQVQEGNVQGSNKGVHKLSDNQTKENVKTRMKIGQQTVKSVHSEITSIISTDLQQRSQEL